MLDFALVERTADEAFLSTTFEHHEIVIRHGGPTARSFAGYQLSDDLADAQRRLKDAGVIAELRSDIGPATPRVLVLAEPSTGVPIHLYDRQSGRDTPSRSTVRPTKLGHIAAFTPDLDGSQQFYQGLLGFRWSDTIGDYFVFMRCNSDHHAANFMRSTEHSGMHHVAFEMRDMSHLQSMLDRLAAHGRHLTWGPARHGPGHNVFSYHLDPDGNTVELFCEIDRIVDESRGYFEPRPWHSDYPQYPKTWEADVITTNRWGPLSPAAAGRGARP